MKKKRYFCDWYKVAQDKKGWIILILVVILLDSCVIWYSIFNHNHRYEWETAYSESDYKYLDEIATKIIQKNAGIIEVEIPEDIVEFEMIRENGNRVFKYYLTKKYDEKDFLEVPIMMTITLSEDGEILSKQPNFSSKEDAMVEYKHRIVFLSGVYGGLTYVAIFIVGFVGCEMANAVSKKHKNRDNK